MMGSREKLVFRLQLRAFSGELGFRPGKIGEFAQKNAKSACFLGNVQLTTSTALSTFPI
jgi:hypothetical protein